MICFSTDALFEAHADEANRLSRAFFRSNPWLGRHCEASDVAQEGLLALARACAEFRPGRSQAAAAGFLMASVRNGLIGFARKLGRQKRRPPLPLHAEGDAEVMAPAPFDNDEQLRALIRRCNFPSLQHGILFAHYGLGRGVPCSTDTLADLLSIPKRSVERLIIQGRQRLQAELVVGE